MVQEIPVVHLEMLATGERCLELDVVGEPVVDDLGSDVRELQQGLHDAGLHVVVATAVYRVDDAFELLAQLYEDLSP